MGLVFTVISGLTSPSLPSTISSRCSPTLITLATGNLAERCPGKKLKFLCGGIPKSQLINSCLIISLHKLNNHPQDFIVYRALPTQKFLLHTIIMQENFRAQQLKLPKIQKHKSFSLVNEHIINIVSCEFGHRIEGVVPNPLSHVSRRIRTRVVDPFISRDVSEDEQAFWGALEGNLIGGDEIKLQPREQFLVAWNSHLICPILL